MKALIFAAVLFPTLVWASPVPGYLKPLNPAPTGHYHRDHLSLNVRSQATFEWVRVGDFKGNEGWALKTALTLPLDLSRKAVLLKNATIRSSPKSADKAKRAVPQSISVDLLQRTGDFYKVAYIAQGKKHAGWVEASHLRPKTKDAGYLIVKRPTVLSKQANGQAQAVTTLHPGQKLLPNKNSDHWWSVRTMDGKTGFVLRRHLLTRLDAAQRVRTQRGYFKPHVDLFKEKIVEIFPNPIWASNGKYALELKALPDMGSRTVITLKPWTSLAQQGYAVQLWSQSSTPRDGLVWWPNKFTETTLPLPTIKRNLAYRLKKKSILQEMNSPLVQGLKFASTTSGVYRSHRSRYWRHIKGFKSGQPMAVANNGTLFVGDKVSFDHGKNFKDYIRWDMVLQKLPLEKGTKNQNIRIVAIQPGQSKKQLTLQLSVGERSSYRLSTQDFGESWQLL